MPSLLDYIFGGEQARKEWINQMNQGERYTQTPSLIEALTNEEKRKRWNAEYEEEKQRGANALPESTKKTITGYANELTTPEQRDFSRKAAGMNLTETVDSTAGKYIPRIRVNDNGNGLVLSGTKTALESDLAKELREYLKDTLQYQNLQSENTAKIIEELNNDISEQVKRSIVEKGVGMDYDKYKDYAHAVEVMSSTNPMNKTGAKNKIFGYDKDGNRVAKTPQEWIDYYREKYNSGDRARLFSGSLMLMGQAGTDSPMDPTLWTPYLVMSGGARSNTPLYGFDLGDKALAGVMETINQASARVIEGLSKGGTNVGFFLTNFSGYARRNVLNNVAQGIMGSDLSAEDMPWVSEKAFNDKLDSLADKSINSLGKEDKSLIIAALSVGTGLSASQIKTAIDGAETVGDLRDNLSYQTYIDNRDNIRTTEQYDEELSKREKQLGKGRSWLQNEVDVASIYAPISVGAGHFIGTMMRYLAESSAISALTGGTIALNQIGDETLGKVGELALRASQGGFGGNFVTTGTAITKALNTPLGHFLGAVITEIPEDIVQTAVDNVITNNANENWSLLTPESIAENTLQNLIMRGVWSVGANAVKTSAWYNKLKQIARANKLTRNVFIDGIVDDNEKVRSADAAGKIAGVTSDGKIKIFGEDGTEQVLDNTHILAFRDMEDSPILQELAQRFETSSPEITFEVIDRAKRAVESGEYSGDVEVRIVQPPLFDVDGHSYTGEGGYQKFITDNLSSNSKNSAKDRMLAIAVEQAIVTPGGDTDNINPLLRSGELVLGGDGEPTSIEFKEKIDNIDIYALAANYYHNTDYFDDGGFGESGVEQNIVDLARELLGKKPLKNFYEFSREDIAAAEKVIRDALEDGVISALKKGNYTLKNDVILYRVVSEGGNDVNQGGDLSWLDKQSGEYSDKGFTSVTLNEDAVLNSPVLSGTGKKYILRYHIPSGENIYAFDGSVRTGDDTPLGDFRRVSSGHRAGGEFMLTPDNNGIFVKSGEFKDGAEYVDVYIGKARDYYLNLIVPRKYPDSEFSVYRGQPYKSGEPFTYNDPTLVGDNPRTVDEWTKHNPFGDAYFFTEKMDWAMEFGNSLVKWTLKESNTLSFDDFNILYEKAKELVADPKKMADYIAKNGEAAGERMTRLAAYDFRAAAELSGKPVIMATEGKIGPEWLYFKGVDEEFDKHAYTQLLASTVPTSPEADVANIRMASSIQSAIDTSPYDKTPADIIADKYINSGSISDAPNSASVKWETPQIEGSYQNIDYAMANQPTNLDMPEVKGWFDRAVNTANKYYQDNVVPKFTERYPTTADQQLFVRNMHYLFDLQRMDGLTVEQAVGKTLVDIDGTKLEIRQEDIDFYNEVLAPYMGKLREYSAAGLKIEKPVDIVGYLPHTSYDPMDMTAEEALQQGVLHRKYSGASASTEDGNFTTTTLSDDLATEFNIFARNMIWDSLGEKAIVAKYMSEYHADGVDVTAEAVETSIKKQRALSEAVSRTKAAKDLDKELNSGVTPSAEPTEDVKKLQEKVAATEREIKNVTPGRGVNEKVVDIDSYRNSDGEVDFNSVRNFDSPYNKNGVKSGKSKINPEEKIILESSLVDSAPATDKYSDFQKAANVKKRNALRAKGYDGLSSAQKTEIDKVDKMFSQKLTTDMVVYRGESPTEYSNNLSVGDPIDSSAWTYVALTGKYTGSYRSAAGSGGVLYRYHLKNGQPVCFHPPLGEMGLPRGIKGTVTNIKNNASGKVFGKFIPEKIVDVEVEPSGVTGKSTPRAWADMDTFEGKIKQNYAKAAALESQLAQEKEALEEAKNSISGGKDIDWKQKNEVDIPAAAKKVGATRAVEQTYSPIYGKARDNGAYNQPSVISLQQTSDVMRKIVTPDGDMYSNGGRMVVAGAADAGYMAKRIFDQANDGHINAVEVKQMFVDYLMQGGKRTQKGAEYIADQWMAKIAKDVGDSGNITQRALTARLNSLVYFEGTSRLKRWVARADLDKFNTKTMDWMDEFFYRQGLLSREINASKTMTNINKAINKLISARMKSLFWLNFKNGVLQSSECVRIFTEFKMGDALETIKRLAADADFRNEVDEWVNLLVPEQNFSKSAELADIYADIAKKSKIANGDISVSKLTSAEEASLFEKIDKAAMTPIDMGENAKNRILIAGILQEAQGKGYTGDQLFNFVNKKFERIGLANNDMGRLAGADNPAFRIATNLKSFSIRQFGMYINNIQDMNGGEVVGYIIKNLGWKIGIAVILAKLGYSVPQSLGIDPFDILNDDYTGVDEEDYNALDKVIAGPAGRALLSGGFTSYLADLYWASRQAYEKRISTPADEVDRKFQERGIFELAMPEVSFDNALNVGAGFIPGYTQGKRVIDMAELQASGWAVSATGNLMYAAPDNAFDTATGYVFGRSNTPNARTYYQTADPLQGLIEGGLGGFGQQFFGRGFNLGGGYRNFDPVDSRNYSDWFYGDSRDDQQWNAGYYYFREQAQRLQNEYQNALRNSYDDDSRNAVYNSYNSRLRELDDSVARFVQAYQEKNPGKFDANKMNNVLTVMRTYQPDLNADELQRDEQFFNANDNALQRYVAAGLPQVVSYKYVEDKERPEKSGTQVEYSPQVRAAMQGRYGLPKEASRLIKQTYNDKWKDLNKEYRDKYYGTKGSRAKKAIQAEYFNLVKKDLDPIVALYGAEIFSNDDVDDVMEDVFNSMTPYGTSVKKYLQGKYKNYMPGTISYSQPGNETITEIRGLLDQGKTARGKALARTLLQRVQENRQALTREELEWLQGVLND